MFSFRQSEAMLRDFRRGGDGRRGSQAAGGMAVIIIICIICISISSSSSSSSSSIICIMFISMVAISFTSPLQTSVFFMDKVVHTRKSSLTTTKHVQITDMVSAGVASTLNRSRAEVGHDQA